MEFRTEVKTLELLGPTNGFKREDHQIEYRYDPLTDSESRINKARAGRVKQSQGDEVKVRDLVERTSRGCIFCPDGIEQSTPKFPPEFCQEGRIQRGQSIFFPNLYPFAAYHAVGTMSRSHYLELDDFTPQMLKDNIMASEEYVNQVHKQDTGARFPVWIWNYLPPSGASIIHPHVQVFVDHGPMRGLEEILQSSGRYYQENGRTYWTDLIEVERDIGERFIAEDNTLAVIASFAPRGNREAQFIFKGVTHLCELNEGQAEDFATAIVKALQCYKSMGVNSFNLITCSASLGERIEHFRMSARIISRPVYQPLYTNDTGPVERFYGTSVIEVLPEDVAGQMRDAFSS
jgi:galactose-1-phosphate uridylyltransferase